MQSLRECKLQGVIVVIGSHAGSARRVILSSPLAPQRVIRLPGWICLAVVSVTRAISVDCLLWFLNEGAVALWWPLLDSPIEYVCLEVHVIM